MPVTLATCRGQIYAILNASTTFGTNDDTERRTQSEVDNAILGADAFVVQAIYETPGHPLLATFKASTTLAHAAALPARVGPILSVLVGGKGAKVWPLNEIERERTNPQTLTLIEPHFNIEGERIFHNGATTATVDYIPVFAISGACQAPDAYQAAVIAGALAEIHPKEGHHVEAGGHYARLFQFYLQMIRTGAKTIPALEEQAA